MPALTRDQIGFLSDYHKDAYGFRPGADFYLRAVAMTRAEYRAMLDRLAADLAAAEAEHQAALAYWEEQRAAEEAARQERPFVVSAPTRVATHWRTEAGYYCGRGRRLYSARHADSYAAFVKRQARREDRRNGRAMLREQLA
jgi:rubrerythrin